jgi:hypothetical protein
MSKRRRGYIAGPMRGYPDLNFAAFDKAAEFGRNLGFDIINPAALERDRGTDPATYKDSPQVLRDMVGIDVAALLSLRAEDGDFIALLPGWAASKGARAEYHVAVWLGLEVRCGNTFHPMDVAYPNKPSQIVWPPLIDRGCDTGTCSI